MVNKLSLERFKNSFFINPIILLHLVILLSVCSLKFNSESNIKHKCFRLSAISASVLLSCKGGEFSSSRLLSQRTSIACLFRSGLKDILHWKPIYLFSRGQSWVGSLNYLYQSLLKTKICHLQKSNTLRLIRLIDN